MSVASHTKKISLALAEKSARSDSTQGDSVSKGSARRPGEGYADGWDRIFRGQNTQAQAVESVLDAFPVEYPSGARAKGDGRGHEGGRAEGADTATDTA